MKKIENFFMPIPFAFISLALAFGALGTGWTQYSSNNNGQLFSFSASWVPYLTMTFVCLIVLFLTLKIIFSHKWFLNDFIKNRISSAHFSVYPLVLMSMGEFILPYQSKVNGNFTNSGGVYILGMIFWYVGFIFSLIFFFYWIILEARKFEWVNVDAVWYVPPAALAGACTNPEWLGTGYGPFLKVWWYIIFVMVAISMIFVWYRYLFIKGHDSELPSIGVLSSVNSFMLLTYSGVFPNTDFQFGIVFFLGASSMTTTLIIYVTMFKTFRGKFVPGLSSYSFPLAASAVARIVFAGYMQKVTNDNYNSLIFNFFLVWGLVELIIATIVNIYLFAGLNWCLFRGYFPAKNNKSANLTKK